MMRLPPASQALRAFPDTILGLTPQYFMLTSAPRTFQESFTLLKPPVVAHFAGLFRISARARRRPASAGGFVT